MPIVFARAAGMGFDGGLGAVVIGRGRLFGGGNSMGSQYCRTVWLMTVPLLGTLACAGGTTTIPLERVGPALPAEVRETSTGVSIRIAADQLVVESEVRAPVERTWSILPRVYAALGIDGQILDSEARVYGNRRFTRSRVGKARAGNYVRCAFEGTGPSAASGYRTLLSIVTRVESSGPEWTTVSSQVSGSATSMEGTSTEAVRCVSNGELERLIAKMLADSAAG